MKDVLHKLLQVIDYERYKVIGILVAAAIVIALVGCQTTIKSPITGEKVTPIAFKAEVVNEQATLDMQKADIEQAQRNYNAKAELLNEKIAAGVESFERAEKIKTGFVQLAAGTLTTVVSGGAVSTPELLMSVLTLLGIGGAVGGALDSGRKNKIIEELKAKTDGK